MMENRAIYGPEYEELRRSTRKFFENELLPNIDKWEAEGIIPKALWLKAGQMGLLCPTVSEKYGMRIWKPPEPCRDSRGAATACA